MEDILTLQHTTKNFGGLRAVDDLCMNVKRGEIHALIGPNGAGKSTIINIITGVYKPSSGSICFSDKTITSMNPTDISLLGIARTRSEEHTSELQSLMRISYAVFCLKK